MKFQPDEQMKQDYIQNKLSPDAKSQFEMWLFEHPSEQEELELDLILKAGVKNYYQTEEQEKNPNHINWLPAFGMAAAFVLMTWGLLMPSQNTSNVQSLVAPTVSVFSQVRSAEQPNWVLSGKQDHLIQIPVDYLSSDAYQVSITGAVDMQIENLEPHLDLISVIVTKNSLTSGDYQLELINQNTQEKQQFAFSVN